MTRSLTVAVAQPPTVSYDVSTNAARHAEVVAAAGARLVVFPELSLTGYELDAEPVDLDDPRLDPIADACERVGAVALVGAPVEEGRSRHIAMVRFDVPGRDVVYRKQHLGGREPSRFTTGSGPIALDVDGWRIGLGICKDAGSAQHIAATARLGVDLYVAGLVHRPEDRDEQDTRGSLIARTCDSYVAFASFAGPTGDEFSETLGRSTIWSPDGMPLARAGDRPGEIACAELFNPGR